MICNYCRKECKNNNSLKNHERCCPSNSNRKYKNGMLGKKGSNQFSKAKSLGISIPKHSEETKQKIRKKVIGYKHTENVRKIISEKALKSKHRRLGKSTRWYVRMDGSKILLDSSWEELLAKRLDELNIEWIRPSAISWTDKEGITHNYFADFYLPQHNLYLDPKNEYLCAITKEKIECVQKILPNLIILRTEKECRNFNIA